MTLTGFSNSQGACAGEHPAMGGIYAKLTSTAAFPR